MSNRRTSSRQHQAASSGSSQRITDEQIIGLMSKLQQLLPELSNRSRSDKKVSAPKVLQETCNYIRHLRKEVDDLSLRLTELLSTIDADSPEASLSWRNLALLGIIPCIIQLLGIFLIPESPRWLAKIGQLQKFEDALQQLRGNDVDTSEEAFEIQENIQTSQLLKKSKLADLFQRKYARSLTVGVGMMAFQQLGGLNGVCYYMGSILESVGFSSTIGSVTYSSFQVAVTLLAATRLNSAGRKPFLLVSASGMLVGCLLVGTSFFLKDQKLSSTSSDALAVIGLLVYGGSCAAGMAPIPWILISEE